MRGNRRALLGLVLFAAIAAACSSPPARDDGPGPDRAAAFEVETFEGETFALAEHRGTPVVINFWESW